MNRKSRRAAVFIAIPAFIIVGTGTAFAVNSVISSTKQLSSGSAAISGCDTEYTYTPNDPTYDSVVGDYVSTGGATNKLEDSCAGQTFVVTILNNSGAVVSSGTAAVNNATKIATVTYTQPVPVGTSYTLKTAIYGTRASS